MQKIKKHMKLCPTLYVIREMRIKTMRYPTHLLEWPKRQTTAPNAGMGAEQEEPSFIAGNNGTATLEDSWAVSYLQNALTRWSRNCSPDIYLNKLKMYFYTKTYTWMPTTALFIIAKLGSNQDVSVDEMINCGTFRQWNSTQCST